MYRIINLREDKFKTQKNIKIYLEGKLIELK